MALINCPECNAEISDQADFCIKCGFKISNLKQKDMVEEIKEVREQTEGHSNCIKKVEYMIDETVKRINKGNKYLLLSYIGLPLVLLYGTGLIIIAISIYLYMSTNSQHPKNRDRILECLTKMYPVLNSNDLNNFDMIESNVEFQVEWDNFSSSKDMELLVYAYANKINADAITLGESSTELEIDGGDSFSSKKLKASFLKLK